MVFLKMKFWNFKRNGILETYLKLVLFKKKKETKIGGFLEMKT